MEGSRSSPVGLSVTANATIDAKVASRVAPTEATVAVVAADRLAAARIGAVLAADGLGPAAVADSADALLAEGDSDRSDAVVIGAAGAGAEALPEIRRLTGRVRSPRVVAVVDEDWRGGRQALNAGAAGLIHASRLEQTLAPAVRAVLAGHVSLPRELRRCAVPPAFSHRERQILALVVRGLANRQIAARLCLAESTVKSHLATAFKKLGVNSRKEAAALLVDPREGLGASVLGLGARDGRR